MKKSSALMLIVGLSIGIIAGFLFLAPMASFVYGIFPITVLIVAGSGFIIGRYSAFFFAFPAGFFIGMGASRFIRISLSMDPQMNRNDFFFVINVITCSLIAGSYLGSTKKKRKDP